MKLTRSQIAKVIGIWLRRPRISAAALAILCLYPTLTLAGGNDSKSPYIAVGSLTATLIDETSTRGVAVVDVNLALTNLSDKDKVKAMLPLLHDRYLQILSQQASSTYSLSRPIDIVFLTSMLQQATDKIAGSGLVTVMVTNAILQRL